MKNNNLSKEFIYQGLALILSIIIVHAFYVSYWGKSGLVDPGL